MDERTHRAIDRSDAASPNINSDQTFPNIEKQRGDESAEPDVVPCNLHVRQEFEDHREQSGDYSVRK